MDYEIKIKINDGCYYNITSLITDIDKLMQGYITHNYYSITSKEVKPIVKQVKVIDECYIKLAQYLNDKNNEKYGNDKQWDDNKTFSAAEQFRLMLNNDKIQYNRHNLNINDCYELIDFALQKDQLYVIQSGQSFRKKVESIIANKHNYENRANKNDSNNNQGFMMPDRNKNKNIKIEDKNMNSSLLNKCGNDMIDNDLNKYE
jgi:hypothetical protein